MPLPNHVRCTLEFRWQGMGATCTLYAIEAAGAITKNNVVQLADSLKQSLAQTAANVLPESALFNAVHIRKVEGENEAEGSSSDVGTPGVAGAEALPEHNAVCLRRKTGFVGRANRGRIFMPFVPEDHCDDEGELNTNGIAMYRAFATKLDGSFVSAGTGVTLEWQQPNFKQNLFRPVVFTELVANIVTRNDRQREKKKWVLAVP